MKKEPVILESLEIGQSFSQGDVRFTRIDEFPDGLQPTKRYQAEGDNLIIAHSESGHHHVLERPNTQIWEPKQGAELIAYILVTKDTVVRHLKESNDSHADIKFPAGKYKVTRGRETTPEGYRRVAD